jgi:integrase
MPLNTVKDRALLTPRREPYWQKLSIGHALGFRPSKTGRGGTWIAKYYDPATRNRTLTTLGDFGHIPPSERFTAAVAEAMEWFKHLAGGGTSEATTVRQACERYAARKPEAAARFSRYVYGDPIADLPLRKLTDRHVRDWRDRLEAQPALVSRSRSGSRKTRPRSPATINRDMVPFRAALNMALERGEVSSALPWRKALEPQAHSGRRTLYLDKGQRTALLASLPPYAASFVRGLCLLPLRPGALASLRVQDFDARSSELTIPHDKAGAGRRILLPAGAVAHLQASSAGRAGNEPLFTQEGGTAWHKDAWKGPIKQAARAAELPDSTTAYTLRHSTITDLVQGGLDLLTVAQLSGTSVLIIERHYGHLQRTRAAQALSLLDF